MKQEGERSSGVFLSSVCPLRVWVKMEMIDLGVCETRVKTEDDDGSESTDQQSIMSHVANGSNASFISKPMPVRSVSEEGGCLSFNIRLHLNSYFRMSISFSIHRRKPK
jgi:hypothetical protein